MSMEKITRAARADAYVEINLPNGSPVPVCVGCISVRTERKT